MRQNTLSSPRECGFKAVARVALGLTILATLVGCDNRKKDSAGKEPRVSLEAEMRTGSFEIETNADALEISAGRTQPMNTQFASTLAFRPHDTQAAQEGTYKLAWIQLKVSDITVDSREKPPSPMANPLAHIPPATWDRREAMVSQAKKDFATAFRSMCERELQFHIDAEEQVSISDANFPESVVESLSTTFRPYMEQLDETGPAAIRGFLTYDQLLPDHPVGRGAVWHCAWQQQWSHVMPPDQTVMLEYECQLLDLDTHKATIAFRCKHRDKASRTVTWNNTIVELSNIVITVQGQLSLNRDSRIIEQMKIHQEVVARCTAPGRTSQTSRVRTDGTINIRKVDEGK